MAFSPEMTMKLGRSFLRESFLLCLFRRATLAALFVGSSLLLFSVDAKAADGGNTAAPVSFAGVCDKDGNGSFLLPGTSDECLEVNTLVRSLARVSLGDSDDILADVLNASGDRDAAATRLVFAYTASFGEDFPTVLSLAPPPQVASTEPSESENNSNFVADISLDRPWEQGVHAEFGSEVKGGFEFNTDVIAPGDKMWLQAAFEKSPENSVASDTLKWAFAPKSGDESGTVSPQGYNFGWNPQAASDCVYTGVTAAAANCNKPGNLSIEGALKHYWAPDLSSTVSGTNLSTDYDPKALARLGGTVGDTQETRIGGSPVWMPMKGLDIGTEFMYLQLTQENQAAHTANEGSTSLNADSGPASKTGASENEGNPQSESRIRVQRQY